MKELHKCLVKSAFETSAFLQTLINDHVFLTVECECWVFMSNIINGMVHGVNQKEPPY